GARDSARLIELRNAVGQHLGMDAKIADPAFEQQRANRVGHAADTYLQAGAVINLAGDEARNGLVDLGWLRVGQLRRRLVVALDDVVDLADMDAVPVSEDIRQ